MKITPDIKGYYESFKYWNESIKDLEAHPPTPNQHYAKYVMYANRLSALHRYKEEAAEKIFEALKRKGVNTTKEKVYKDLLSMSNRSLARKSKAKYKLPSQSQLSKGFRR